MGMAETVAPDPRGPAPSRLYRVIFFTVGRVIRALFRIRWIHSERVPVTGPVIIVGNHVSYVDPFSIGLGLEWRRPIHFMAKAEMYKNPILSWGLRVLEAFPVNRGAADRAAIRTALEVLSAGGIVGMFPEGTRTRGDKTSEPQMGAAFIGLRSGSSMIPVGVSGTDRIMPPGRRFPRLVPVTIVYGEPIDPSSFSGLPKDKRLQALTTAIMQGITTARQEADALGKERA
jgi:1-acyl-sn-glycerol-3-phosphate acyltransferase